MTQSKKYDPASLLELTHYACLQTAKHDAKIKQEWKVNRTGTQILSFLKRYTDIWRKKKLESEFPK